MRASDLIVGESYRNKTSPQYCWAKVVKVLKPKEFPNNNSYIVVKCECSQNKNPKFGLIKYFKPKDLQRVL